jgi:threonine-phosphate decarboxylase
MIREERAYLAGELTACGIRVYPGEANYLLIRSAPDLYDRLLAKGILIRHCANFSGLDDTYFRIAVRRREENEALIKAIGEVL